MKLKELIETIDEVLNFYHECQSLTISYLRQLQKIRDIAQDASGYVEFYERTMEVLKDVY